MSNKQEKWIKTFEAAVKSRPGYKASKIIDYAYAYTAYHEGKTPRQAASKVGYFDPKKVR